MPPNGGILHALNCVFIARKRGVRNIIRISDQISGPLERSTLLAGCYVGPSPLYGSANFAQQRVSVRNIVHISNRKYFVDKMCGKKTFDLWTLVAVI